MELYEVHCAVKIDLKGRDPRVPFIVNHKFAIKAENAQSATDAVVRYCLREEAGYVAGMKDCHTMAALVLGIPEATPYPLWPDENMRSCAILFNRVVEGAN